MLYRNAETKSFALSTFYILISGPGKREAKSLILMLDFFLLTSYMKGKIDVPSFQLTTKTDWSI
jgi:hypothetical protein